MSRKKVTLSAGQQSELQSLINDHVPLRQIYRFFKLSEGTIKRLIKEYNINMANYSSALNSAQAHKRFLSEEEIKRIQTLLSTPGYSQHAIAKELNMSYATLRLKIKEYHINDTVYKRPGNRKFFSDRQKKKIKYMLDAGKTYTEISQLLNLNRNTLAYLIDSGGIEGHTPKKKRSLTDADKECIRLMQEENISILSIAKIIGKPIKCVQTIVNNQKEETLEGVLNAVTIYCDSMSFATERNIVTVQKYNFIKENIHLIPFQELQERTNLSLIAMKALYRVKMPHNIYTFSKLKTYRFFNQFRNDCLDPTKNLTQLGLKYGIGTHTIKRIREAFGDVDARYANYLMLSKTEIICADILKSLDLAYIYQKQIGSYKVDYYLGHHLIIEVQGDYFHQSREQRDLRKKQFLEENGYQILYIWEHDLECDQESVADTIMSAYRKAFLNKQ